MMRLPRFYPVLDTTALEARACPVLQAAEALLEAGVQIVQYRHKNAWTQVQFDEARRLGKLCEQAKVLFVLNDRADFARLLNAALHIGQEDLPPVAARIVVGAETVIGFSTHNRDQMVRGDQEPVQYVSLGPIFVTASKDKPDPVVGINSLVRLRGLTSKPLVAIGGITLENVGEVLKAGADSVAVISGILGSDSSKSGIRLQTEAWLRNTNVP